ncbi:hypothetical protein FQP90_13590 [Paenarthrobacter nitroguajacolicus]|uniref:Minor tail protein n=1 Tax=Paenarthrobacter nitroguajacolicus TaxID=211146 RepID=A0A558GXG0_PAENT|nr:hypothetical protein [Paenarthrobacter nitroguajacolicus]TVU61568.1 hypothetical protein FQP90_13590 [Paenarthrobacter nitroguajacolicus]
MWKFYSVSTSTWGDKIELPASTFTGGRRLNGGSQGTATFNLKDPGVAEVLTKQSVMPWERMLVAQWEGEAVYAGFITNVQQLKGIVTVTHKDVWALWERRHILTVRGDGDQSAAPITWTNKTLATHANLVVNRGMTGSPAGRYSLPLIMDADVVGPDTRTWYGYKFTKVSEALKEIMESEGGPNVDFDPQWDNATETFRWVMRSGSLTQGEWEWDATAPKTDVKDFDLETDADHLTNRHIGTGEGSERSLLVRDADSFTGSGPALETVESYDTPDGGILQGWVNANLSVADEYTQQASFKIPTTGEVPIKDLLPGGTVNLQTTGQLFLDHGWHEWRLIGFTFDKKEITLQMQQIGG